MYPWENYADFMDAHIRVSIFIDNELKGSFAILDDGTSMDVKTFMPDGRQLVLKNGGHPRTTDQRMTVTELVDYVLTNYK
jgi:hypothetical protein